jgi:hypothetical protein
MNYAKVENGQVTRVGLPTTGTLTQGENAGCTVSGYDKQDESILIAEGWRPLTDNPPVYDSTTQYLEHAGYTVGASEVTVNYAVKTIVLVVAAPTTEDRLAAVEEALLMII